MQFETLHRATGSWDGKPYDSYPEGQPVLSLVKISIPPQTTLDWHCHQALNLGYLVEGELKVETRDGKTVQLRAGDTLAELVDDVHRGHTQAQPATVMVFHAATKDFTLSTPAAQCPPSAPPSTLPVSNLLAHIQQRLYIANDVALHKWDLRKPVQDSLREQQLLQGVQTHAAEYGLSAQRAVAFFSDQIEANKMLQYNLLSAWHAKGEAPDTPRRDLVEELRPQLDKLQADLLHALASFDARQSSNCARQVADDIAQRQTTAVLKQAMIRASGQLCDNP
ncbi:chorismate mutase [Pseudomonas putida]